MTARRTGGRSSRARLGARHAVPSVASSAVLVAALHVPAAHAAEPPPPPPELVEVDPANYKMVLAGDIIIGLGGAGLITMAVGLGIRADARTQRAALGVAEAPNLDAQAKQDRRIQLGTRLAIAGGASAGALFVTGITLVALGYARERRRRASLVRLSAPTPTLAPDRAGLSWAIEF